MNARSAPKNHVQGKRRPYDCFQMHPAATITFTSARRLSAVTVHARSIAPPEAMDDGDISGFPPPAWTNLLDSRAILAIQRAQPMTLALPCIGIDACSQALADMRVPFVVKYAYDVKACLARPLTALHGDISHFRLGHMDGDLLAADVHAWERVDGVVACPPCPPWSQCAKRGSWTDPQAQVFGEG